MEASSRNMSKTGWHFNSSFRGSKSSKFHWYESCLAFLFLQLMPSSRMALGINHFSYLGHWRNKTLRLIHGEGRWSKGQRLLRV